jgi:preprotein translocase subunit YajC
MSTTETIVVIVAIGAVVYLVTRQQAADKPAAEAPAPSGYGRNRQDFFAELSEDISGAVVALGGQVADVEKKKLEVEAAKKTG